MSVRLKDAGSVISIRWIPKYTVLERLGHWMHAGAYVPLAITGFLIFEYSEDTLPSMGSLGLT